MGPGSGGPLRYSGDSAMSPLVLATSSSPTGAGCHGTDVAEASSVLLSPGCSAPWSSGESAPGRSSAAISSPVLAGPSMVLGSDFPPRRLSFGDSSQEGSPLTSGVFTPARRCRSFGCGPWGGATRSFRSLNRGCWDRTPIQSSLSEETVRLEVGTFTSWCGGCQLDPVNCPFGTVLEFVQACSSTGLTHSTLKVMWWQFCLPHLSWWAISGQSPPGYTFPPQLCVW